jgi:hypothetical protein
MFSAQKWDLHQGCWCFRPKSGISNQKYWWFRPKTGISIRNVDVFGPKVGSPSEMLMFSAQKWDLHQECWCFRPKSGISIRNVDVFGPKVGSPSGMSLPPILNSLLHLLTHSIFKAIVAHPCFLAANFDGREVIRPLEPTLRNSSLDKVSNIVGPANKLMPLLS